VDILIETDVPVPMRDGVRLATDIYRAAEGSPAPVLLARTPYDKRRAVAGAGVPFDIIRAVRSGYAVMVQDVRGRYASEGRFDPHFQEADDGIDTLAWVAGQSWSAGVVGTFGGSYLGGTQWAAARHRPSTLRAMAPAVTPSDMYEGTAYQGGAHVLHGLRWAVSIAPEELQRRGQAAADLDVEATLRRLPLGDNPLLRELTRLLGLAGASHRRRLLASGVAVHRVRPGRCAGAAHHRLVRHLPVVDVPELSRHARPRSP
jgi:putative CocE/NonD family hydrolase